MLETVLNERGLELLHTITPPRSLLSPLSLPLSRPLTLPSVCSCALAHSLAQLSPMLLRFHCFFSPLKYDRDMTFGAALRSLEIMHADCQLDRCCAKIFVHTFLQALVIHVAGTAYAYYQIYVYAYVCTYNTMYVCL